MNQRPEHTDRQMLNEEEACQLLRSYDIPFVQGTIAKIPGVTGQDMQVVGYIQAEELTMMLREMLEEMGYKNK